MIHGLTSEASHHDDVTHQLGLPVLYSFRRCPYAMRARLALIAAGQHVEIRELVLRDKPAHMLELSPKGTVPVLWLEDGTVIDESLDVMHWALAKHRPEQWLQLTGAQAEQGAAWVRLLDGDFKHHLDRYKYPNRYDDCDPLPHRIACMNILKQWDQALAQHANLADCMLFGGKPSWVDMAILPFVRQFRIADEAWFDGCEGIDHLKGWLHRFLTSDLLAQAMPKLAVWKPGDKPLTFPG